MATAAPRSRSSSARVAASSSLPATRIASWASSSCTMARKLCVCGPITIGTPNCAGSSGLCPPPAAIDPPTNATAASEYNDASSPIVSSRTTLPASSGAWSERSSSFHPARRVHCMPEPRSKLATASKRSGCRGASTSSRFGSCASNFGHAASSAASSPSSVLPATTTRIPGASVRISRVASASCAARTSNFKLPLTATCSGVQPIVHSLSASTSLCASTQLSRLKNGCQSSRSFR